MEKKEKRGIGMTPVSSSNVESIGYDEERQVCKVRFRNGGEYEYTNVSSEEFSRLLNAESVGKHLNIHIKNKPCAKCEGEKNAED